MKKKKKMGAVAYDYRLNEYILCTNNMQCTPLRERAKRKKKNSNNSNRHIVKPSYISHNIEIKKTPVVKMPIV